MKKKKIAKINLPARPAGQRYEMIAPLGSKRGTRSYDMDYQLRPYINSAGQIRGGTVLEPKIPNPNAKMPWQYDQSFAGKSLRRDKKK